MHTAVRASIVASTMAAAFLVPTPQAWAQG